MVGLCNAQSIIFSKVYGGPSYDEGFGVSQTSDNGFLIFGNSSSMGWGNTDVIIIKTDSVGNVQWNKAYGGSGVDLGKAFYKLKDSTYVVCGFSNNGTHGGYDLWVFQINKSGVVLWDKKFGGADWEIAHSIIQTNDNNLAIVGETYTAGNKQNNVLLMKIGINGDSLWAKTFGGDSIDIGYSVAECYDKGFIIGGCSNSYDDKGLDMFMIKTDSLGTNEWQRIYGDKKEDCANSIIQTPDSGFVAAGYLTWEDIGKRTVYILKTNKDGSKIWESRGGHLADEWINKITTNNDGGFYSLGLITAYGEGKGDFHFMILGGNGYLISGPTFGSLSKDEGVYFEKTRDKGYIMLGNTQSFNNYFPSIYVIKTDSNLTAGLPTVNVTVNGINQPNSIAANIATAIYPNPANENIVVSSNKYIRNIKIFNTTGVLVYEQKYFSGSINTSESIDLSGLASGMYFVTVRTYNDQQTERLVISRY